MIDGYDANYDGDAPLPDAPTGAVPGTPAKLNVMAKRAMRGESLWHPGDVTLLYHGSPRQRLASVAGRQAVR